MTKKNISKKVKKIPPNQELTQKVSRIVQISKTNIHIQLSTECPDEDMEYLTAKASMLIKDICRNEE